MAVLPQGIKICIVEVSEDGALSNTVLKVHM